MGLVGAAERAVLEQRTGRAGEIGDSFAGRVGAACAPAFGGAGRPGRRRGAGARAPLRHRPACRAVLPGDDGFPRRAGRRLVRRGPGARRGLRLGRDRRPRTDAVRGAGAPRPRSAGTARRRAVDHVRCARRALDTFHGRAAARRGLLRRYDRRHARLARGRALQRELSACSAKCSRCWRGRGCSSRPRASGTSGTDFGGRRFALLCLPIRWRCSAASVWALPARHLRPSHRRRTGRELPAPARASSASDWSSTSSSVHWRWPMRAPPATRAVAGARARRAPAPAELRRPSGQLGGPQRPHRRGQRALPGPSGCPPRVAGAGPVAARLHPTPTTTRPWSSGSPRCSRASATMPAHSRLRRLDGRVVETTASPVVRDDGDIAIRWCCGRRQLAQSAEADADAAVDGGARCGAACRSSIDAVTGPPTALPSPVRWPCHAGVRGRRRQYRGAARRPRPVPDHQRHPSASRQAMPAARGLAPAEARGCATGPTSLRRRRVHRCTCAPAGRRARGRRLCGADRRRVPRAVRDQRAQRVRQPGASACRCSRRTVPRRASLMRCADLALHAAKRAGNTAVVTTRGWPRTSRRGSTSEAACGGRSTGDEFRLCYQPIYDIVTGRIVAVEASLRWLPEDGPGDDAGRFHPDRRGDRPDPADRRLGAARGLPAGAALADRAAGLRRAAAQRQRVAAPAVRDLDPRGSVQRSLEESGLPAASPHAELTDIPSSGHQEPTLHQPRPVALDGRALVGDDPVPAILTASPTCGACRSTS